MMYSKRSRSKACNDSSPSIVLIFGSKCCAPLDDKTSANGKALRCTSKDKVQIVSLFRFAPFPFPGANASQVFQALDAAAHDRKYRQPLPLEGEITPIVLVVFCKEWTQVQLLVCEHLQSPEVTVISGPNSGGRQFLDGSRWTRKAVFWPCVIQKIFFTPIPGKALDVSPFEEVQNLFLRAVVEVHELKDYLDHIAVEHGERTLKSNLEDAPKPLDVDQGANVEWWHIGFFRRQHDGNN